MEFIDLKAQYDKVSELVGVGIQNVLIHGKYIMGPEVLELEEKLAAYCGVAHCISCSNGTDALQMVLMAWGVGPGDAVFVPTFTFMSTAEVVRLVGAVPIFVDCDERSFNMCPKSFETAVVRIKHEGRVNPKVVIPVDLFGQVADFSRIDAIAEQYQLKVLEDGAQSFGASRNGRMACSFGHAAATSFFPAKPLGCYGDGGAIFTNDEDFSRLLKSIRVHGQGEDKYDNVRIGLNARIDTLQAAILLAKMTVFSEEIKQRQRVASEYSEMLKCNVITPVILPEDISAWAQYSILAKNNEHRERILSALKAQGIPAMVYYQKPLHMQTAFTDVSEYQSPCPVSEDVSSRILSLPMHPYLDKMDIERVASIINSVEA